MISSLHASSRLERNGGFTAALVVFGVGVGIIWWG
jgi:hypothetical protein